MFDFTVKGFLLGLSLGTSCLATCGPVFLPYLLRDKRRWLEGLRELGLFLGGRFVGYAIFGALFGLFGMAVPEGVRNIVADSAYVLLGGFLIITTIRGARKKELCPAHSAKGRFTNPLLLGLFTGLNLCPSFALAIGSAFDTGGPLGGIFLFTGFFFGTTLWFLPMFFLSGISHLKAVRTVAKVLAVVVGGYFLVQGIAGLRLDIPVLSAQKAQPDTEEFSFADIDTVYIVADSLHTPIISDNIRLLNPAAVIIPVPPESIATIPPASHGVLLRGAGPAPETISTHSYFISVDTTSIQNLAPFLSEYYFRKRKDEGFIFVI